MEEQLTVYHYKEPLLSVEAGQGFGYYGALSVTENGNKAQCHVCGLLFMDVGLHARQKHHISADAYREKFQLARLTSLISETLKEDRKDRSLRWFHSLTDSQKASLNKKRIAAYRAWQKTLPARVQPLIRLETKNKRGTCPDQIIAKILECAESLGKTPDRREFLEYCGNQRYLWLMKKNFGSWTHALKRAKLEPRVRTTGKGSRKPRKTNEELLDALSLFYQENGRLPTESDARRGWIPDTNVYYRRFGSIRNARKLAGLPDAARVDARNIAPL